MYQKATMQQSKIYHFLCCFCLQQAAVFREKVVKCHCTLPTQQTADKLSQRVNTAEHLGAKEPDVC